MCFKQLFEETASTVSLKRLKGVFPWKHLSDISQPELHPLQSTNISHSTLQWLISTFYHSRNSAALQWLFCLLYCHNMLQQKSRWSFCFLYGLKLWYISTGTAFLLIRHPVQSLLVCDYFYTVSLNNFCVLSIRGRCSSGLQQVEQASAWVEDWQRRWLRGPGIYNLCVCVCVCFIGTMMIRQWGKKTQAHRQLHLCNADMNSNQTCLGLLHIFSLVLNICL